MADKFDKKFQENCRDFWAGARPSKPYFSTERTHKHLESDWEKLRRYLGCLTPGITEDIVREAIERWTYLMRQSKPSAGRPTKAASKEIEGVITAIAKLEKRLDNLSMDAGNRVSGSIIHLVKNKKDHVFHDRADFLAYLSALQSSLKDSLMRPTAGNQKKIDMHAALGELMVIWRWAGGAQRTFGKRFDRFARHALLTGLELSNPKVTEIRRDITKDMNQNPQNYELYYLPPKKAGHKPG